jgi:predicted short-subunit dehydrogenase-like oxidoreductase (DUF2520 family)
VFETVRVIGKGRVGSAVEARLAERGLASDDEQADLTLLCVPDTAIAAVAASLPTGRWIAHVSGATPLAALAPHGTRFGVHPLQTFGQTGDAGQLDGAWAAVTAEGDEARARGFWLAGTLGLRPFALEDGSRVLYHAGAVIASNYLVTLYRSAAHLFDVAGAPPEALVPLMTRTIENGFDLTGPIARGDVATVNAHLAAIAAHAPALEEMYRALAKATKP